ncbi:MAG: type II toxin-antitoxin system RelE/ParE family toxin [Devosia sp.]|nr:type II toxin-antitoxin system RelE/ParE family toxin [Devosia sp.]
MQIVEYLTTDEQSPFANWFDALDPFAATKVTVALARLAAGNISNVKGVGGGVLEQRIDFGPGYRTYFARDGETVVVLLAGGTKRRQQADVDRALMRWHDYKNRKKRT